MAVLKGKLPLVHIVWKDHAQFTTTEWRDRADVVEGLVKTKSIINSVGWIIYEDKEMYVIAATLDEVAGFSRSEITIFKSCVIRKRRIT